MSALAKRFYTEAEYAALESRAEYKSEFVHGEILAMAGASTPHNVIAGNIFALIWAGLRGRTCQVFGPDQQVRIAPTGLRTYPDVSALCGPAVIGHDDVDYLINTNVLVEVLSPSTERWDRGGKSAHYRRLESLQEYVFVAQDEMRVEHYRRQHDHLWTLQEFTGPEDRLTLGSIGCELALAEIYERVELPPAPSPR